jgi:protein transport protein SEC20
MTSHYAVLNSRLAALSEQYRTGQQLINRLANLQYAPGSPPQPQQDNDGSVRQELLSEIRELLKRQEEDLDVVRQDIDELPDGGRRDQDKEREKERLVILLAKLKEDLKKYVFPFSPGGLDRCNADIV